ncbi:MAG: DUF4145 domain-containing protein [Gammaproteobacteria bacterium]|nr:DUF4145 domain-containing protein [Gammaproteobacteria bacterium]MCF6259691.1 DUF4145 domain-containing protein [Gammaproteobacteria bacterium]
MVDINITKNVTAESKIDAPCGKCKADTKHLVLTDVELKGREATPDYLIYGWDESYQIIQCLGCESVSFKKTHQNSEDEDHWKGPDGYESSYRVQTDYYPNPEEGRGSIEDEHLLPAKLQLIYEETLGALNINHRVLAGIGIRAIVETVCKDNEANGNNLAEKIDSLVTLGVLTRDGADILHKLRVLGNEAAHEVTPHDNVQLGLALDVIDHLLTGVYILPHHAKAKFS